MAWLDVSVLIMQCSRTVNCVSWQIFTCLVGHSLSRVFINLSFKCIVLT